MAESKCNNNNPLLRYWMNKGCKPIIAIAPFEIISMEEILLLGKHMKIIAAPMTPARQTRYCPGLW